jgi:predicted permease
MNWFREIGRRLWTFIHRNQFDSELQEEMRLHRQLREQEEIGRGLSPEEAHYAAKRRFGNEMLLREQSRDVWGWNWLESLIQDIRYGARMLAKHPGFTFLVAGLLALGIGSSTVIFSLFDAVFLRTLPVRRPGELVRMVVPYPMPLVPPQSNFAYPYYEVLRDHTTTLAAVFAETGMNWQMPMTDPEPAEYISVDVVTPGYFQDLGARALLGRLLLPEDEKDTPGAPPAVLSYGFWNRRFGGDPNVVNRRTLLVNGVRFLIVGVTPRDFNGIRTDTAPEIRVPLRAIPLLAKIPKEQFRKEQMWFELSGRLKPGVSRSQAEAECQVLWRSTMKDLLTVWKWPPQYAEKELARGMQLEPLARGVSILRFRFGGALKLLMFSVAVLLLIFCTNIAGLLLERAAARQQEITVRLAVGAGRFRLVRQLLVENLLLAALGTAGALLVTVVGLPLAIRAMPPIRNYPNDTLVPLALDVGIHWRLFLFLLALSLATTLFFSLSPALAVSRVNLDTLLRSARARGGWRGRKVLIALQIGLCTFLLSTAGLFVRTFHKLKLLDPGFDQNHIATFTLELRGDQAKHDAFLKTLTERVSAIPGVDAAGSSAIGVMKGTGFPATIALPGHRITEADFINSSNNYVSPGYFAAMGMRILSGRDCLLSDAPDRTQKQQTRPVKALVNETFQRKFFPNEQPIGKLFGTGETGNVAGGDYEIIGVVNDAHYTTLRHWIKPTFYACGAYFGVLNVHTRMRPDAVFEPVRKTLASLDPSLVFTEVHSMSEEVDNTISGERITAALSALFAGVAALLVGVGLYGLLAYIVTQRRPEIGLRMALGAQPAQVGQLIARQTIIMGIIGIICGLGATLAIGPLIRSLLYAVSPLDPVSIAAAVLLVVATVAAGTAIPARRATHIDPMEALRYE